MTSPGDRGGSAAKPRPASVSSARHSSEPVRCRMSCRPACSRRPSNVDVAILGTTVPAGVWASAARVLMPPAKNRFTWGRWIPATRTT